MKNKISKLLLGLIILLFILFGISEYKHQQDEERMYCIIGNVSMGYSLVLSEMKCEE